MLSRLVSRNAKDNQKPEFIRAPRSFHTVKKRDDYCKNKMIEQQTPIFTLKAYNIPAAAAKLPDEVFFGLENTIHL
jgi:hypothetical protein